VFRGCSGGVQGVFKGWRDRAGELGPADRRREGEEARLAEEEGSPHWTSISCLDRAHGQLCNAPPPTPQTHRLIVEDDAVVPHDPVVTVAVVRVQRDVGVDLQVGECVLEEADGALGEAVGVERLLRGGGLEVVGGLAVGGRGWRRGFGCARCLSRYSQCARCVALVASRNAILKAALLLANPLHPTPPTPLSHPTKPQAAHPKPPHPSRSAARTRQAHPPWGRSRPGSPPGSAPLPRGRPRSCHRRGGRCRAWRRWAGCWRSPLG